MNKRGDSVKGLQDVITVDDMAQLLKLNTVALRRRVSNGGLPGAIRIGRVWRIPRSVYEAVLKNGLPNVDGGAR
mgnify:CR=1 FL=1